MVKEIRTEITIQSSVEKVWAILTDVERYPDWNPFIVSLTGPLEKGKIIGVKIAPPGSRAMTFRPTILTRVENRELSWLGTVIFRGLFDGKHTFELIDHGNGTLTFIQRESFSGLFVGLFNPAKTEQGFNAMNRKLKELAERDLLVNQ